MANAETLMERRRRLLGPNVPAFYEEPVHIVRGEGVWLWDADGRKYLDCYNNVPHVGHCHPHVVAAIARQAATLNTHTRYLHEGILDYVERLTATFAPPLSTALLTCTGSEANDIALRMAQAVTGKTGIIATDYTYHGNTALVSQLSGSNRPTVSGGAAVRFVPAPDSLRPLGGQSGAAFAAAFTAEVVRAIAELESAGAGFSALMLCPYFANEGFPDLPAGFLDGAAAAVRKAGGILIADEVQPGFGRLGDHFWGHQAAGVTPDIVTLGKPMGNGHPIAGVITSPDIMTRFRGGYRYFNTYGGNAVSCAAAMAVLDVLEREKLPDNAAASGRYARDGLKRLAAKHAAIGDVRGQGLFFGAEMVLDRKTLTPATAFTKRLVNTMRRNGVLINFLGRHGNVLKVRPPMPWSTAHADLFLAALDAALSETPLAA